MLSQQIKHLNKDVEVLVADDCSTAYQNENKQKCAEFGFKYITNNKNRGRIVTRLRLAKQSINEWVLFLDADTIPTKTDFIAVYWNAIKLSGSPVVVGGHCYKNPTNIFSLRARYGKAREEGDITTRIKNPFDFIFFSNIAIKKSLFIETFKGFEKLGYGEDILFAISLKQKNVSVHHISNGVYHLGIENNLNFLKKIEMASETASSLYDNASTDFMNRKLIIYYELLKKYKLLKFVYFVLRLLKPALKTTMLLFGGPLMFVDMYRLLYFLKHR